MIYKNASAAFEFHLGTKYKAGVILQGWEIKSFRSHGIQLKGSYVKEINGSFWLIGSHISNVDKTSANENKDPLRFRELLLTKHELKQLREGIIKRFTIVPTEAFIERNKLKFHICLAKGKNKADKRETIKKRDLSRLE